MQVQGIDVLCGIGDLTHKSPNPIRQVAGAQLASPLSS